MDGSAAHEREGGIRVPMHPDPFPAGTTPVIRLACGHELEHIAVLFGPALERYRGHGGDWLLDEYIAELVDVRSRCDTAETYVAVDDQRVLGSVAFYRDVVLEGWSNLPSGWAGFRALVVDPAVHGAGIGRALVEHCIARARMIGAPALGIHTVSLLTDAVRLYERVGFVRCPEFDLRVADIYPSATADDMVGLAFRYDLS